MDTPYVPGLVTYIKYRKCQKKGTQFKTTFRMRVKKKIAKFFNVFEGPYRIKKQIGLNTYILKNHHDDEERGMFHSDLLFPYRCPQTPSQNE